MSIKTAKIMKSYCKSKSRILKLILTMLKNKSKTNSILKSIPNQLALTACDSSSSHFHNNK